MSIYSVGWYSNPFKTATTVDNFVSKADERLEVLFDEAVKTNQKINEEVENISLATKLGLLVGIVVGVYIITRD